MSIDGIKSRKEVVGSIDGFSVRQKHPSIKPAVKRSTPTKKPSRPIQPKKEKKPIKKASETFLEPVESFDFDISSDEIAESELRKTKKKAKKKIKKKHIFRRVLLIVLLLLVILSVVVFVWGDSIISKITGGQSGILDVISFVQENYVDLKTDEAGRTNVLIFGTSGYDMEGTNGDYAHDGAQLTDTIMVVSLDQKNGDVAMINLPRDLKVANYCTGTGKINEVYWCNDLDGDNEENGAQALVEEVEDVLGVKLQYYAHINWNTLVTIVDTLGGITVTVDEDINDYLYTGIVMNAGVPTTLDGEKALGLARARHGTALGDFSRGNSQQKILVALKERVLEKGLSVFEVISILNSLGDNVRTNISLDEVKTGMHLLKTFDVTNMRQVPLLDPEKNIGYISYYMENNISYVVPFAGERNYAAIQEYVNRMFNSDPVVREGSTIEVLNGTGESGVASKEQKLLEMKGFNVELVGDAPEGEYDDFAIYVLNEEMVGTKAKLENYYNIKTKTADEIPGEIASGCDFLIIIGNVEVAE